MSTARPWTITLPLAATALCVAGALGSAGTSAGGRAQPPWVQASFGWDRLAAAHELPIGIRLP